MTQASAIQGEPVDRFIAAALRADTGDGWDPQEYLGHLLRSGATCSEVAAVAAAGGGTPLQTAGRNLVVIAMVEVASRRLDAGGRPQQVLGETCFDLVALSYVWHVAEALSAAVHPAASPGFTINKLYEWVRGGPGRATERAAAATANRKALPWMRLEAAAFLYAACIARGWVTREQAEPLTRYYRLRDVGQVRGLRPAGPEHPFAGQSLAEVVAGRSTRRFRLYVDERYQSALRSLARWEVFVAWSRYLRLGRMLGDPDPRSLIDDSV